MKKQRFFTFFLCLLLCLTQAAPVWAKTGDFSVDAKAALLVEESTGEVLYEQNAHERNYPASITKVMTALLVLEAVESGRLRLTQEVVASESAFVGLAADGSTANIKPGEILTVEQLLCCLLIVSANEAAPILAETVSGSVSAFVEQMNAKAAALGCEDTHFVNPTGLHNDQHYTTAWDVYLITRRAMTYKTFSEIVSQKAHDIPATNISKGRTLHSTNYLISTWRTGWPGYWYEGADGVKTGSTPEAGYCLVATAARGERRLTSVVLGAERVKLEDGTTETRSFSESAKLLDYGFDNFRRLDLLSDAELICEVPVDLSSEANYVVVHPAENLTRMVPANLNAEDFERTVTLTADVVDAPIAEGDVLGTVTIRYDDVEYGVVNLLALNDVSASKLLIYQRKARELIATTRFKLIAGGVAALLVGIVALRLAAISRARRYRGARRGSSAGTGYSYNGYRGRKR